MAGSVNMTLNHDSFIRWLGIISSAVCGTVSMYSA